MSALQDLVSKFLVEAKALIDLQTVNLPANLPNVTPPSVPVSSTQPIPNIPLPIPETDEWAIGATVKVRGMGNWQKLTIVGKFESTLLTKDANGISVDFDWQQFEPNRS